MKKRIYLDYASSTPLDSKVLKEMMPFLKKDYGNPSSLHWFGQKAKAGMEQARERVAAFLNCKPLEVVFTSGATEANNFAVQGLVASLPRPNLGTPRFGLGSKPHIITSQIEHESVLSVVQELEMQGLVEATYVPVDSQGIVSVEDIAKAIKGNTLLVSVMYANSEIGTVQPIQEIGAMLQEINARRSLKVLFHTDAVQAAQFLDCDVQKLFVDLLTLSSHKLYGPKGAGALYAREGVALSPLILGGGQEQGLRSGTEHVAGIVGMGRAIEEIQNPKSKIQNIRIRQMRDKLIKLVLLRIKGSSLTGSKAKRLANNAHFLFEGIEGKDVVMLLDEKGIAVSTGSACSEKTQEPSHVLLALGLKPERAMGSVRITLGKYTKTEEIEKTVKALVFAVEKLRSTRVQ